MDITIPELGEGIVEAEVLKVLVQDGDTVVKDQPLLELETDKSTFELPSPHPGTVTAIHVKKGDTIRVGQKVLSLGEAESSRAAPESRPEPRQKPERKPEAAAKKERVEKRDTESESGDSTPRHAPRETEPEPDDSSVHARTRAKAPAQEAQEDRAEDREPAVASRDVAAGPAARRLARGGGVDLVRILGTGSGGRITTEDVEAFIRDRAPGGRDAAAAARPAEDAGRGPVEAEADRWGPVERRSLTGIEKAAARHLAASWTEIPHVTHHDVTDVTELEAARARYAAEREQAGTKLTWTALVVKAAVAALRAFPQVNSSLDTERDELVLKRYIHIGVAVDTEHGLLVPVLRDADRKTTRALAAEVASLAERARARKLAREEMQGASFTVTNLGGIGGVAFTPIVSRPEVAILGVSRSREELALREGQVVRRVMLPLSLSYDHRVINGAEAARFVRYVAELLEDPLHLLLES